MTADSNFYLIRSNKKNSKVFGILSESEVLTEEDYEDIHWHRDFSALKAKLQYIAGQNVGCDNWYWYWEEITQAEYETYRDLYGFKVFTRPIVLDEDKP